MILCTCNRTKTLNVLETEYHLQAKMSTTTNKKMRYFK